MKKLKYILYTMAISLQFIGCSQEFDEINKNPNNPEEVITPGIFNNATKILMDNTRGGFPSGRMTLPWVQYSAQQNYTEEDRFQFREGVNDTFHATMYTTALNFKSIIELNTNSKTKNQMSVYGDNDNQIAASRIMLSYLFSILADTYGSIAYYSYGNSDSDFQALQSGKYIKPIYASQEKVYTDILEELKKAANQIHTDKYVFTEGDNIFGGDAVKWKKFANSLRLRIANRVKGVIPTANTHITDAISSGVMTSNDDNAVQRYDKTLTNSSPLFNSYFVGKRTDFKANNIFVDVLKGELANFGVDPRLQKMIAPRTAVLDLEKTEFIHTESPDINDYEGMPYGITNAQAPIEVEAKVSYWSKNVIKANYSEVLMEYSEVLFLLSEVNGWDDNYYRQGVRASMEKWGVATADINAFVATLPIANKANVLNQKYIALYMQPQEAYAEIRRTGYPNFLLKPGQSYSLASGGTYTFTPLSPATYTLTEIPARITYPVSLQKLNPEGYNSGVTKLGPNGDRLTTKLIWDTN